MLIVAERTRTGDGDLEPIIQRDDDLLDEFVLSNCTVHLEAMSDNEWWIGIDKGDRHWAINLGAKNPRAGAYAFVEEDTPTATRIETEGAIE